MRQDGRGNRTERRGFLKLAGLGAAASTVGVVTGPAAEAATAGPEQPTRRGYHETPHVKKYYELARF